MAGSFTVGGRARSAASCATSILTTSIDTFQAVTSGPYGRASSIAGLPGAAQGRRSSVDGRGPSKAFIVPAGKHAGRSYDEILRLDRSYVEWVLYKCDNPGGWVLDFKQWLQANSSAVQPPSHPGNRQSLESRPSPPLASHGRSSNPPMDGAVALDKDTKSVPNQSQQEFFSGDALVIDNAEKLAFMMIGPNTIAIVGLRMRGHRTMINGFLGRPLWEFVTKSFRAKAESAQKQSFVCIDLQTYPRALQELQRVASIKVEPLPNFVLYLSTLLGTVQDQLALPRVDVNKKIVDVINGNPDRRSKRLVKEGLIEKYMGRSLREGLHPFQLEGVNFAFSRNGRALIADEMGLGKTLQALALAAIYREEWPTLVICPSAVKFQWYDQASKWLGGSIDLDKIQLLKTGRDNLKPDVEMVIVSYDLLTKNKKFQAVPNPQGGGDGSFKIIICDESHFLKSTDSKRSKEIVPLLTKARRALLLSGTPALNKPSELYNQFQALLPKLATYKEFSNRYCDMKPNFFRGGFDYDGSRFCPELNYILAEKIMIRRLKCDVATQLPEKQRNLVKIELNTQEMTKLAKAMNEVESTGEDGDNLKRAAQGQAFSTTAEVKARAASEYMQYLVECNCKHIMFGHHQVMLDVLETKAQRAKIKYIRIDGSTPGHKREHLVKNFQNDESVMVAILSITACGVGLDLTATGTVVFSEFYWVPGVMIQAEDRAHRIGSTFNVVDIHYLFAEKSLDTAIWGLLQRKWKAVTSALDGAEKEYEAGARQVTPNAAELAHAKKQKRISKNGCFEHSEESPITSPTKLRARRLHAARDLQPTLIDFFKADTVPSPQRSTTTVDAVDTKARDTSASQHHGEVPKGTNGTYPDLDWIDIDLDDEPSIETPELTKTISAIWKPTDESAESILDLFDASFDF